MIGALYSQSNNSMVGIKQHKGVQGNNLHITAFDDVSILGRKISKLNTVKSQQ